MLRRALLLLLAVSPASAQEQAETRTPNVLFIVVDDLNDWIGGGWEGHPQSPTPNIDRLAARGVSFTKAYCPAPQCNASRVAVMTGIPPHRSGVYGNENELRLALPKAVTIPQHFSRNGYNALGCGKVFHNMLPDPASWKRYFPSTEQQRPNEVPASGVEGLRLFDWAALDVEDAEMSDTKMVDWAVKQLNVKLKKPLFLAVGLFRPHTPWYVPRKWFDPIPADAVQMPETRADDLADVPEAGRDMAHFGGYHPRIEAAEQWSAFVRGYLASIRFVDAQIGRLLDGLEASGRADDTIVVLWSDSGIHLGEKEHWGKYTLWEESTRSPLIVAMPGQETGTRCETPVSLLDLYPTLIELCGLRAKKNLGGTSLVPLLSDPSLVRDPVLMTNGRRNHAVRDEDWRYIRYGDGSEELYDHRVDPNEWTNLAADPQHVEVIERLAAYLPTQDAPAGPHGADSSRED